MIKLTLPIYYTQEFKTKKPKTFLVGMNWYRNAHYHIQNKVKKDFGEIVKKGIGDQVFKFADQYQVVYTYHYKSAVSDLANVTGMTSKFVNDTLQELGVVPNDNVKFLVKETHIVGEQDKDNPRVEVEIIEYIRN